MVNNWPVAPHFVNTKQNINYWRKFVYWMSFQSLFFTHDVSSQPSARCFWIYHFELIRQGQEEIGFKLIFTRETQKPKLILGGGTGHGELDKETGEKRRQIRVTRRKWQSRRRSGKDGKKEGVEGMRQGAQQISPHLDVLRRKHWFNEKCTAFYHSVADTQKKNLQSITLHSPRNFY